jgi:RND family efflux transporter MFP subunit
MEQRRERWVLWTAGAAGALLLLAASYAYVGSSNSGHVADSSETEQTPDATPSTVHVRVTHPQKGEMDRTTTQPGSVQSYESVRLFAGVSGYLKTLNVDIGDRVAKGQILARVSVPELDKQVERHTAGVEQAQARVRQAKSRLASVKADLEAAKAAVTQAEATVRTRSAELRFRDRQFKRMQELFALKSIDERLVDEKMEQRDAAVEAEQAAKAAVVTTKAQVSAGEAKIAQAEADIVEAEAEVKVARADLDKAKVLVQFATISAPFDGVITQRALFPGDFVRAATEGGGVAPLLTVQRTDRMRVVVQVPDRDVPYTDPGDPAIVEIDALPGQKFPAQVSRLAQSEDPATRLMRVEIDLPNPSGKIRNGMYGHVTIILDRSNEFGVPSSCLVGRAEDGKGTVYVVRDGHAHQVPVRIGADDGLKVAVLDGLKPEDEVILHPSGEIVEGTPVVVNP